ncbi:MAG: hypothetical protein HKN60_02750 [Rhizobiales bacterium]|nr:hypothetical protein [Hyphomicrobiales bacterium]
MIIALTLLFASHTLPSAPIIRDWLIARLGRRVYFSVHGVISMGLVVWIIRIYMDTQSTWVWSPPEWFRWAAILIMPVALWLVAARLMQKPADQPTGIYRICAAPGSAGVSIWAGLHLMNIGHTSGIALFAAFAAIAAVSLVKNWLVAPAQRRVVGPVPFLAMIAGRQKISASEFSYKPLVVSLALWAALLALHATVIGVDPLIGVLR